jgi:hypothetical protein
LPTQKKTFSFKGKADMRVPLIAMLAKRKPYKGGNLDDFIEAAEVEKIYGSQRYELAYQDVKQSEYEKRVIKEKREYSLKIYKVMKQQILIDHLAVSFLATFAVLNFFDMKVTQSYFLGTMLGAVYLKLSQRSGDMFGQQSEDDGERKSSVPTQVIPVLAVLLARKFPELIGLLPILAGFFTERLSIFTQAFYPQDMGMSPLTIDQKLSEGALRPLWFVYDKREPSAEEAEAIKKFYSAKAVTLEELQTNSTAGKPYVAPEEEKNKKDIVWRSDVAEAKERARAVALQFQSMDD